MDVFLDEQKILEKKFYSLLYCICNLEIHLNIILLDNTSNRLDIFHVRYLDTFSLEGSLNLSVD